MSVQLVSDNYGKARVRLLKVSRPENGIHTIQNLTVKINFEGDFKKVHTHGDNANVLPTDTMKNTVYGLAAETSEIEEIEGFAVRLGNHFLNNNKQVDRVTIDVSEQGWVRNNVGEQAHPHAFTKGTEEKRKTRAVLSRADTRVESGLEDLIVLKTTKSGFVGYIKDRYTTLAETTDRIFATSINASWIYDSLSAVTAGEYENVRKLLIETFSEHDSLSVQQTLYALGEAVLDRHPNISGISLSLPNIHFLPVNLEPFGLENANQIFLPTDEPHGLIEARLARSGGGNNGENG